jgi:hypothetical protein
MEKMYKQMEESIKGTNASFSRPSQTFGWKDNWGFQFPYWLPTLITGYAVAVLGWSLQWQFGLRTLLVTATIIAATLGLLVVFFSLAVNGLCSVFETASRVP